MMSDVLWFFDVKKGGKIEPRKSESPVKRIFQDVLLNTETFYSGLESDWDIDLSKFRDNNGTQ